MVSGDKTSKGSFLEFQDLSDIFVFEIELYHDASDYRAAHF